MESVTAYQEAVIASFQFTYSEFSLMVSISTWSTMVLGCIEGLLIDKMFGVNRGLWIYLSIYSLGACFIALGVLLNEMWYSHGGMLVTGIGSSGMFVCLSILCVQYFKGKELSLMLSMMMTTNKFGTSVIFAVAEPLLNHIKANYSDSVSTSCGIALFIACGFLLVPFVSTTFLTLMNPKGDDTTSNLNLKPKDKIKWKDIQFRATLRSIFGLPFQYWLIQIVNICYVTGVYMMVPFVQGFFSKRFNMTIESTNILTSQSFIVGGLLSPVIGFAVDNVGRELHIIFIGFALSFVSHLLLIFSDLMPHVAMFMLAVAFALFCASVTPLLAFVVPANQLGIAFGLGTSIMGGFFSLYFYVLGVIIDNHGYNGMELFITTHAIVGLLAAIILFIADKRSKGILNMSAVKRKLLLNEKEADGANEPLNSS